MIGMLMKKIFVMFFSLVMAQSLLINTAIAKPLFSNQENMTKQVTHSGLNYQIIQQGNGKKPLVNDEVEIRFTSYNVKGEVLEGTLNGVPVILPISEMFTGLQESLLLMPVGSIYEFDIPAHLGYQEEGKQNKQAVKYRIELLRINP